MRLFYFGVVVLMTVPLATANNGCSLPETSTLPDIVDFDASAIEESKILCTSESLETSTVLVLYQCIGISSCGEEGKNSVLLDLKCIDGEWEVATSENRDIEFYNRTSAEDRIVCSRCLNETAYENLQIYPEDSVNYNSETHCLGKN